MTFRSVVLLTLFLLVSAVVQAQPRVDSQNLGERVYAVVPIIGTGTYADPKRPLFAPASAREMTGILHAYQWEPSDDGRFAIVEYVSRDKMAVRNLSSDARVAKTFVKGRAKREDIERELRVYKKDFKLDRFDRRPK